MGGKIARQWEKVALISRPLKIALYLGCPDLFEVFPDRTVLKLEQLAAFSMSLDHLCYGIDVCIGKIRILESEICPQREKDLVCLVMTRIGLHACHQEVDIALVLNSPTLEMRIHVIVILLVYPHVDTTCTLVHLMRDVCEHAFLSARFRPEGPLKKRLPDELELLPLLTSIFFEVINTPKE